MNLVVAEIFYSLQGEGPLIGSPAIFIRMAGCIEPLCTWCDTKYAWFEFHEMNRERIMAEVGKYSCRDVVITGGEPFLQWDTGLHELHDELMENDYNIHYETSGKVGIPDLLGAAVVLSPKHIDGEWQVSRETVRKADLFKFVADDQKSMEEIHEFVEDYRIRKERVFIMPMGTTRKEQFARMEAVFTFCLQNGYQMSPRLHILIFEGKRGI